MLFAFGKPKLKTTIIHSAELKLPVLYFLQNSEKKTQISFQENA